MQQKLPHGRPHGIGLRHSARSPPIEVVALGIVVGIGYWFAARLSLVLLTPADGVAVFWPAAGIASGVLIALGPKARLPVAAGVMAATIAANLQGDRNLATAIVFAFCNAGEALFAAWLIGRRYGSGFNFDSVRHVLHFLAAIAVAAVVSGAVATVGFILFHNLGAPVLTIWLDWSAADALGAVAVAPLIIGLARLARRCAAHGREYRRDGGTCGAHSRQRRHACDIVDLLVQHRTSGYDLAAAVLAGGAWPAAVCCGGGLYLRSGHRWDHDVRRRALGGPDLPLVDRVHAARAALLVVSLFGFILAALFAEKRHNEATLWESNERLRLAVGGAELGIWSVDLASGRFDNDGRDRQIHGHDLQAPPQTLAAARSFINSDDLVSIDAGFRASGRARSNYTVDYRLAPATGSTPAPERWVALEGTVVRDAKGRPIRLLGVTRDITERKQLEGALQRNERKFRELLEALPAAIYVTDADGYVTYGNQAAVNLWGTRPKFGEDRWCDLARFYDRHGAPMPVGDCPTEIALRQGRSVRASRPSSSGWTAVASPSCPIPRPCTTALALWSAS